MWGAKILPQKCDQHLTAVKFIGSTNVGAETKVYVVNFKNKRKLIKITPIIESCR